MQSLNKRARVF